MSTIVSIENVSKLYRLGVIGSGTLREDVTRWWARFRGKPDPLLKIGQADHGNRDGETIWALKDVSFEVKEGEIVGIIGRNGAGKSTLLKILSRVTAPTSGEIKVRGRVASLLEVGTGFHPELTGRENIFLNGAILGMTKVEIRKKLDEIVAFAEIDKFLETPVKRYSSGMYVRLAFAIAAHLDPEILVVDEVLAVGDAAFQKKCIGKMSDVAKGGRTVLFVSHNMGTINRLCGSAILLDAGKTKAMGPVLEVTAQYLRCGDETMAERLWPDASSAPGDETAKLRAVRVIQGDQVTESIDIRYPVTIEMEYDVAVDGACLLSALAFFDEQGTFLFVSGDTDDPMWSARRSGGRYVSRCEVPGNIFAESQIRIVAEVSTRAPVYHIHFLQHDAVAFQVVDKGEPGSVRAGWGRPLPGVMRPKCAWRTCNQPSATPNITEED